MYQATATGDEITHYINSPGWAITVCQTVWKRADVSRILLDISISQITFRNIDRVQPRGTADVKRVRVLSTANRLVMNMRRAKLLAGQAVHPRPPKQGERRCFDRQTGRSAAPKARIEIRLRDESKAWNNSSGLLSNMNCRSFRWI